jgi:hypothetical protein
MTIVSSVLPFTAFVALFSFLWPLYRLFFRLQLLSLYSLSYDHCIVCSSVYSFCRFILFLMTIVSSVLPFTAFVALFSFLWPMYRLIFGLHFWLPLWYIITYNREICFYCFLVLFIYYQLAIAFYAFMQF